VLAVVNTSGMAARRRRQGFPAGRSGTVAPKSQENEGLKARVFKLPGVTAAKESRSRIWSVQIEPKALRAGP